MSLLVGEPSTKYEGEDGLYEEELVDFELTPPCSQTMALLEVESEGEEKVSGLVLGLEAVGGNLEASTSACRELITETTTTLLESGYEKLLEVTGQLPSEKSPSRELHIDGASRKYVHEGLSR